MAHNEDDTKANTGQDAGHTSSSTSGGQEDQPRYGTKVDTRETDSKTGSGGGASETEDRPRDGK
jgi:hypothetical protein